MLGDRNKPQPAPAAGKSIIDSEGASGGPQAASLAGDSLLGEGLEDIGDDAVSWMDKENSEQPNTQQGIPEQGATGGPGAAPAQGQNAGPGQQAAQAGQSMMDADGGAQGGPGAAPQAAGTQAGQPSNMMDQGAAGGPGAGATLSRRHRHRLH